jgi:hypothetical protein
MRPIFASAYLKNSQRFLRPEKGAFFPGGGKKLLRESRTAIVKYR